MKTKLVLFIGLLVGGVLGIAGVAQAHGYSILTGCDNSTHIPYASFDLNNYNGTNTISIKIDNVEVGPGTFGVSYVHTFHPSPSTVAHTVHYKIVAHDGPDNAAWSPENTLTIPACQTPASTTTTIKPPDTTIGEDVVTIPTTTMVSTTTIAPTGTTIVTDVVVITPPARPETCDRDANGNWNFTNTIIPCAPPTTTVQSVIAHAALPQTGTTSSVVFGVAMGLLLLGALALITARRHSQP